MTFLPWADSYSVGNEDIDWDHRTLFEMVNQVHDSLESVDLDSIWEMLDTYTREHFGREEGWMAETSYPAMAEHRKEHAVLVSELSKHRAGFATGTISRPQILHFLKLWLIGHIRGTDSKLAKHLRATPAIIEDPISLPQMAAMPARVIEWPKIKAVVIDGQANIRHIVKAILRSMGITEVLEASEGADALKMMQQVPNHYDVIIAEEDPGQMMSGIELSRLLRTQENSPAPEAVMLITSGAADLVMIKSALAAGAHDVLTKPFSTNGVRQRLTRYLETPLPFKEVKGIRMPIRPQTGMPQISF